MHWGDLVIALTSGAVGAAATAAVTLKTTGDQRKDVAATLAHDDLVAQQQRLRETYLTLMVVLGQYAAYARWVEGELRRLGATNDIARALLGEREAEPPYPELSGSAEDIARLDLALTDQLRVEYSELVFAFGELTAFRRGVISGQLTDVSWGLQQARIVMNMHERCRSQARVDVGSTPLLKWPAPGYVGEGS
jgi:hypothetical protein